MARLLIIAVVLLAACKKQHTIAPLQATATVTGSVVVITATCGNADSIAAQVTSGEAPNGEATSGLTTGQCTNGTARIEVPIAKLGKGPQTIHVRASDPNGRTLADTDLKVDASAAGQGPFLRVAGCEPDPAGHSTVLSAKIDDHKQDCRSFGGARIKLQLEATPKAKLTIAGKTLTVPDSGTVTQEVDLVDQVLALPLTQVESVITEPAPTPFRVPFSLESDGKTMTRTIELTETSGSVGGVARDLLQLVGEGKADRSGFTKAKPGERLTVGWLGPLGKLTLTDHDGTVRDLDVIVVERETKRTENGTCEYEADGKHVTAKRVVIDIELAATHLPDGEVEKTQWPSPPDPRNCSQFAVMDRDDPKAETRVPDEVVKTWLETLAKPR